MKTINDLRDMLGKTMEAVLNGTITSDQARAIALVAAEVNNSAKMEIELARATDGDFKGSGFIDVEPKLPMRPALVQNKQ